jgi:ArsR family transcriptional regulator
MSIFLLTYIVLFEYIDNSYFMGVSKLLQQVHIEDYNDTAEWLKVLAHPVRLCILHGLLDKGECNVGYIQECLELPQSTVSQHLQKLRAAKIITSKRNGLEMIYRISDDKLNRVLQSLF